MSENSPHPVTRTRQLGVVHLIFGLVFTGIAAIWLIGEATNSQTSELAAGFPAVLIGAGVIGLVAVLINQRRAKTPPYPIDDTQLAAEATDQAHDTVPLSTDKDPA